MKKKISIVTPCYNEEENVEVLYNKIKNIFDTDLNQYDLEYIFIDNCSQDKTVEILTKMAQNDKRVKVIINSRNFGIIRSPNHAYFQTSGDAVIAMTADLQDPPELVVDFVKKWEEGYKIVVGVKSKSKESPLIFLLRKIYYKFLKSISEVELLENFMGFGLYDRKIIDILKEINDPYPYFRGLICEIGFKKAIIEYNQPQRKKGTSKSDFYTLYDTAMLGITSNSKVPLRLATMLGFLLGGLSLLIAFVYFVYKLIFWKNFTLGLAPLIIGLFFFSSVQLFFIGLIGEYLATIYTKVINRPMVIEDRRINFDEDSLQRGKK